MSTPEQHIAPRHVAIIMDGNGRWASQRGLPRSAGHKAGIEAVRRAVKSASELGVEFLTIYSFSTENWSRPKAEVSFLLELLRRFIRQDVAELHAADVCIKIIGSREKLEHSLVRMIEDAERLTQHNKKLTLVVAFNYGSRQELAQAARQIAAAVKSGEIEPGEITVETLAAHLETAGMPDADLMIRTGGEERLSNFLLWQCAYAEFVFMPQYWPDFSFDTFSSAIEIYHARERRFGGLKAVTA